MDSFLLESSSDISNMTTIKTNIFVFVDTNWPYSWIVDYVVYVLQNLNIHPYASTVTLFAANDASIIVNTTDYIVNLYEDWNSTTHYRHKPGFNLPIILNRLTFEVEQLLSEEHKTHTLGGHSLVALMIPSPTSYVDEHDYNYCRRYFDRLSNGLPNLHFIYYGGGALVRFYNFVSEPSKDLYQVNLERPPEFSGNAVIKRIRQVPRRISNPRCHAMGHVADYGINSLEQYARLGSINFYRLDALLYTPGRQSMRYLKITPISQITFTVCTSRRFSLPFRNLTSLLREDEACGTTVLGAYTYDLTDACVGYDYEPCPPIYFSVQAQGFGEISCTERNCQTPDEAQYLINLNNLGCNGGSTTHWSHGFLFSIMLALAFKLSGS